MTETPTIEFTKEKLERLRRAYRLAERQKVETFTFDGHELLVRYAKYLIEYLDTKFGSNDNG